MAGSQPADPSWQEHFPEQADLDAHVNGWPVSDAVPNDMAGILRVVRALMVQSYHDSGYTLVAITWSLLALEAGLYRVLDAQGGQQLSRLLVQAKQRGLIHEAEVDAFHDLRQLRNKIVHGHLVPTLAPAAAVQMVAVIHEAVSFLYQRAATQPRGSEDETVR